MRLHTNRERNRPLSTDIRHNSGSGMRPIEPAAQRANALDEFGSERSGKAVSFLQAVPAYPPGGPIAPDLAAKIHAQVAERDDRAITISE